MKSTKIGTKNTNCKKCGKNVDVDVYRMDTNQCVAACPKCGNSGRIFVAKGELA